MISYRFNLLSSVKSKFGIRKNLIFKDIVYITHRFMQIFWSKVVVISTFVSVKTKMPKNPIFQASSTKNGISFTKNFRIWL